MLKTKFFVRQKSGEGVTPIYVRVTNGRAFDIKTKTRESCIVSHWNEESGLMKDKFLVEENGKLVEKRDVKTKVKLAESKEVNERLQDLERKIHKSFAESEGILFNLDWLKDIINPSAKDENIIPDDFVAYCETFTNQKKHDVSKDYINMINRTCDIVSEFIKQNKIKKLKFQDINQKFSSDLISYLLESKKFSKSYISNIFKNIRVVANHAERNGLKLSPQIKYVKCKTDKTIFQILTLEELKVIENHVFEDEELDNVRDWLIISAFSGQRISDFMRFETNMISTEKNNKGEDLYFLDFTQDKTGHILHLAVHPKILDILNKRNFQFPKKMNEDRYNKLVKKVCEEAGINEICYGGLEKNRRKVYGNYHKYQLVSSHIGRRSFASNNYGKIPTPLLMTATGHKSEGMFLKYIGKVDNQQSHALANYFYE